MSKSSFERFLDSQKVTPAPEPEAVKKNVPLTFPDGTRKSNVQLFLERRGTSDRPVQPTKAEETADQEWAGRRAGRTFDQDYGI